MDDDKGKVVDFKPKDFANRGNECIESDDIIEIREEYQELDLPEDFIYNSKNISTVITLVGFYRLMGLDEENAREAAFMFVDLFGADIGLVPEMVIE
jgi:hypothetical protein